MNEVTKLYKNAGIEKSCNSDLEFCPVEFCDECNLNIYPEFTAEKQLELIKWLAGFWLHINNVDGQINISTGGGYISYCAENLIDAIALCINSKWNNLSEEERKQVKGILE